MKQPENEQELAALHQILRHDTPRFMQIVNGWLVDDPRDADAYFSRHQGWMRLGEPRRALDDLNTCIDLEPGMMEYLCRGDVHRHLGEYPEALEDYRRGEAINPALWEADAIGLYNQADVHARLGDEAGALAHCARLPDDFWTPGLQGAPAGGKAQIADALRSVATAARRARS